MLKVSFIIILTCVVLPSYGDTSPKRLICGALGDCTDICTEKCGCDNMYYFNEELNECMFDIDKFKANVYEKYDLQERIRVEAENTFVGLIIAASLFLTCSAISVLAACVYCCRIVYTDHRLNKQVLALSQKLKREGKIKKVRKEPLMPVEETCSIVIEDAEKKFLQWNMIGISLMDLVIVTFCVLLTMAVLCCTCCVCMKYNDLKMKSYIMEMAKNKGINVDLDKLDSRPASQSPHTNENCTIMVPEVGIIL